VVVLSVAFGLVIFGVLLIMVENLINFGSTTTGIRKTRENYWTFEVCIFSIWVSTLLLSLILFSLIKMQAAKTPTINELEELNDSISSSTSDFE
jgi:hypothetical protein